MEGQQQDSQQESQRHKVLEAAFAAFNHAGYHDVSTDGIAKSLHMSKKTLYRIFRSKEEMLDASISLQFDRVEQQLTAQLATATQPKAALWLIAQQYVALHTLLSPQLTQEIRQDVPYVQERITRFHREHFHKTLTRLLKEWRDAGLVEYPSPTKAFATAFFHALDGQGETPPETLQFLCNAIVKGITASHKEKPKERAKVNDTDKPKAKEKTKSKEKAKGKAKKK